MKSPGEKNSNDPIKASDYRLLEPPRDAVHNSSLLDACNRKNLEELKQNHEEMERRRQDLLQEKYDEIIAGIISTGDNQEYILPCRMKLSEISEMMSEIWEVEE